MSSTRTMQHSGPRRRSSTRHRGLCAAAGVALIAAAAMLPPTPAHASAVVTAWSWGANKYGELGDGTKTDSAVAQAVVGTSTGFANIFAGARHTLAIQPDGRVVAWGRNTSGELGTGNTTSATKPVGVVSLGAGTGVVALDGNAPPITTTSPSGDGHSMALKSDGTVLGWGNNNSGEVGNGVASSTTNVLTPTQVVGLGAGSGVIAIAAGASHSMALKSNGAVLDWGNNNSGQLGNGSNTDSPSPVAVSGLGAGSGVIAIAAGSSFSMALKSNGTVWTWGNNSSGELGNGTSPTDHNTPVQVSGISSATAISAGDAFAMALNSDGTVMSWGNNASGELGDGSAPTDHDTPVHVSGITASSGVVAVTTGFDHSLARTSSGQLYAWGRNASGQLGDGGTSQHSTAELLSTFTHAASVSAGGAHTEALRAQNITPTISIGDSSIYEGDSGSRKVTFPVTLSQPGTSAVTVNYTIGAAGSGPGFAVPGVDFVAASGTISFPVLTSGKTAVEKTVTATIMSDGLNAGNKIFDVHLSTPTGGFSIDRADGTGTIGDDDPTQSPSMAISGGSIVQGEFGSKWSIKFAVVLSAKVANTVTVTYTVVPKTAIYGASATVAGADYGGKVSGTLTFLAGVTTKVITIPVWPELDPESPENFAITLSNLSGITHMLHGATNGLIINDNTAA